MLTTKGFRPNELGDYANAAEKFKKLKEKNGSRWAAIWLEYRKLGLDVWFVNLDNAYRKISFRFMSDLLIPLKNFHRDDGTYISFHEDDIFPHDETVGYIRYTHHITTERGRQEKVYKAKSGKIIREYLSHVTWFDLSPKMVDYLAERGANELRSEQMQMLGDYKLKVDDDFEFIYSGENAKDNTTFGSCQCNKENWDFYNLVDGAQAVSLIDKDGYMVARAVLYNKIHVLGNNDVVLRGLERQYSYEGKQELKYILIDKVIKAGLIDIYKSADAGAYDTTQWKRVDGSDMEAPDNKRMFIKLKRKIEDGDPISWGDSFAYIDEDRETILNHVSNEEDYYVLHETDSNSVFEDIFSHYDEYAQEQFRGEPYEVMYDGERITVSEHTRDRYFCYVRSEDEYYHDDEVCWCEEEGDYFLLDDCVQNGNGDYVPKRKAVKVYTDYDNNYYEWEREDSDEIVLIEADETYYIYEDDAQWINETLVDSNRMMLEFDGTWYRLEEL